MQYCSIHGITGVVGVHEGSMRSPEPGAPGRRGIINSLWTE
jgi:hypothetical protein